MRCALYRSNWSQVRKAHLRTRIQCKKQVNYTALAERCYNPHHKADFDNVKILNSEPIKQKRLFSEMLYIHTNRNNMNRILDTIVLESDCKNFMDDYIAFEHNKKPENKRNHRYHTQASSQG